MATFLTISLFVFINASQGFVLAQIINIPINELGYAAGSLTFYDELLSLVMVFIWGLLSDFIGRRTVYSAGFLFMSLGLFSFTFAGSLYPDLLIFRLIFALGGSASSSMLTAVLADQSHDSTRGILKYSHQNRKGRWIDRCVFRGWCLACSIRIPTITRVMGRFSFWPALYLHYR
jgi:MFS family permease